MLVEQVDCAAMKVAAALTLACYSRPARGTAMHEDDYGLGVLDYVVTTCLRPVQAANIKVDQ